MVDLRPPPRSGKDTQGVPEKRVETAAIPPGCAACPNRCDGSGDCDDGNVLSNAYVRSLIRHISTSAGAILVARGYDTSETAWLAAGALGLFLAGLWSAFEHRGRP